MFGTPEQKQQWLIPLLEGEIRSCFSMTEPDVASSDARNIRTRIERDGDEYVITGRKWFSSGAADPRCKVAIVMGVTDPDADPYHRQSMILVPLDTPGVVIEREPSVFGYHDRGGHPVIHYDHVRVPASNLLGEPGSGFAIAQARLGPGRIHHCMRSIGAAERCFDLMASRAKARVAFGKTLAVNTWDRDRFLAWVADRAMQVFGGAGLTDDFPLARFYSMGRWLQVADGPNEVHKRSVARAELRRYEPGYVPEPYPFD